MRSRIPLIVLLFSTGVLAPGCREAVGEPDSALSTEPSLPDIPKEWPGSTVPVLARGREVWVEHCENCHGIGKAESPRFGDYDAWKPRLAKGEAALIDSAIHGFEGASEGGMPARGGEEELSDEDVAAAVKYMIHFSSKPEKQ